MHVRPWKYSWRKYFSKKRKNEGDASRYKESKDKNNLVKSLLLS